MAFGITPQGLIIPQLTDIQTDINNTLTSTFGADINLGAESVFGQISGIFSEREALIWQAIQDVYNSQNPDEAFGASLDNVGSIRGIPRLGAMASTITNAVKLFGTNGTIIPAGTQFSVQNAPTSIFALNTTTTLGPGQSCIQILSLTGVPASGSFVLTLGGSQQTINWNDSAATIQTKIRNMLFASGCVVTGSLASGTVTITFAGAGTGGFMIQPQFVVSSNTLQTSGLVAVPVVPGITTPGIDQASVSVTAVDTGPIVAPAGTLTVIATPVSGLTNVLNTLDATVGRNVETDNAYRARMAQELQIAGAGTFEAIRSHLLQLSGVTAVVMFENDTEVTDLAGHPPKSFEAVVQGGTDDDIANLLWQTKPAGILTDGSTEVDITDSQGQTHQIRFSRPTPLTIYIIAQLTVDASYPANGDTTVAQALVNAGNALGIGVSVIVTPKLISALAGIPGIDDAVILIGTAPSPSSSANIPVASNEIAVFDTSRVSVVHV